MVRNSKRDMNTIQWFSEQTFELFEQLQNGKITQMQFCNEMANIHNKAIDKGREEMCDFAHCYVENLKAGFNETPEYYLEEYEAYEKSNP